MTLASQLEQDDERAPETAHRERDVALPAESALAHLEREQALELASTRRATLVSGLLGVGMGLVLVIWAVLGPRLAGNLQLIIGLLVALEATAMGFALGIYARHRHVSAVERYLARLRGLALRLQEMSVRDSLTGLYNHGYLLNRLEEEIAEAQRHQRALSLIILDLDKFKEVNDRHGHLLGDEVLQMVAATIERHVRQHDVVARYGGDEFCLVLAETERAGAVEVAKKLQGHVAELSDRLEGWTGSKIGFGFGVASYPKDGATARTLIAGADAELYRDKNARPQTRAS